MVASGDHVVMLELYNMSEGRTRRGLYSEYLWRLLYGCLLLQMIRWVIHQRWGCLLGEREVLSGEFL